MRKFYQGVTSHPKLVMISFLFLAVVSLFTKNLVGVNYDMKDYLPPETQSTKSLDLLEQEFDGGIPNARVMIRDITIPEALEYKEKLLQCQGVTDVIWMDDSVSLLQPLETLDTDTVETYYKEGTALFTVTISEHLRTEAVEEIRSVIGTDNAMSGSAVSTSVATTNTIIEINKIIPIAVLFVLAVLLLSTSSWLQPVIVLTGLGIAIVINAGSNIIFGEISFVTNAAGSILLLAVSLDYSVFLMHRFEECLKANPIPKEAMVEALCKSTSSILSSGLTTVIGFMALIFMRFRIGPDLGLALAKGVAISLITVFTFMPVLMLLTSKWVQKTKHRSFLPGFTKFGKVVFRVMIPMVCLFAVTIIPSYLASNSNSYYYGSAHMFGEDTQLGADTSSIEEVFWKSDTYVVLVPSGDMAKEQELSNQLQSLAQVKSIISYVDTVGAVIPLEYLESDMLSKLVSENYSRMVLTVEADFEGSKTFSLVNTIRDTVDHYYPDVYYLAGEGVSTYDLMDTITADTLIVNLIAIGAVFLVLLLTMKSITLPVILVLCIETAIWINLSIPYFSDSVVFYISYLIISSIQLGATVDYAILFTDRYMEYRQNLDKKQAVIQTVSSVTVSVLTSGSVLTVVGFLLGYISSNGVLSQLGVFLGWGGLLSLCTVLFVLPGLLYLLDSVIRRTTLGTNFFIKTKEIGNDET